MSTQYVPRRDIDSYNIVSFFFVENWLMLCFMNLDVNSGEPLYFMHDDMNCEYISI